jgi:ribosome-binding factor A
VFGSDEDKAEVFSGIKNASGYIRRLIAERLDLRQTPAFTFVLDDSVEYGIRMTEKIKAVINDG